MSSESDTATLINNNDSKAINNNSMETVRSVFTGVGETHALPTDKMESKLDESK